MTLQEWIVSQYGEGGDISLNFEEYASPLNDIGILVNSSSEDKFVFSNILIPAGKIVYNNEAADLSEIFGYVSNADDIEFLGTSANDWIDISSTPCDETRFVWSEGQDYLKGNNETEMRFWSQDDGNGVYIDLNDNPLIIQIGDNITEIASPPFYLGGTYHDDTLIGNQNYNEFGIWGGNDTISGGLGVDRFNIWSLDGEHTIKDYESGELIQFDESEIISSVVASYSTGENVTRVSLQTSEGTITPLKLVGNFSVGDFTKPFDDDYELRLITSDLLGDNLIVGTEEDDDLYGFSGNDTLDGRGGEDSFWGGG